MSQVRHEQWGECKHRLTRRLMRDQGLFVLENLDYRANSVRVYSWNIRKWWSCAIFRTKQVKFVTKMKTKCYWDKMVD